MNLITTTQARRIAGITTTILLLVAGACSAIAPQTSLTSTGPMLDCAAMASISLPSTNITSATVTDGPLTDSNQTLDVPTFCRVIGTIKPQVNFEVWLPLEGWNGKYQGVGNGGMAGRIRHASLAAALKRGYATAATDTGHKAGPIPFDASWGMGRPDLIEDFGHRGLHVTTVAGKKITERFYGRPPEHAYYVGCSKGGQQGLMEVQRYPNDFDGVIAGNPANDWTRFYTGSHLWYSQALLSDPESYIPPEKLPVLGNAVNAACDGLDGIEDGILQDPRQCQFDLATLTCALGEDNADCLTAKQTTAVKQIWSGVRNSAGHKIFPGLVPGGEASPGGWGLWVTGDKPFTSLHWRGGEGFFRHLVFEDKEWDFRSFDYDRDLPFALAKVGAALDSADANLQPFRDAGGKLIVYHGWSDADISPLASIAYLKHVMATMLPNAVPSDNPQASLAEIQKFYRLFMVPGMGHCRGGPGPDQFDALTALEHWVEDGIAPTKIIASKVEEDTVTMTRPLCAYPEEAIWDGVGDTNDEQSFRCALPNNE